MAYQHDPDGPVVDRGALRAHLIEKLGFILLGVVIIFIIIKIFSTDFKRREEALSLIRLDLRHCRFNYTLDESETVLSITLWDTGITTIAKKAYNGEQDALSEWNKVKDNVLDIVHTVEEDLLIKKIKDVSVIVYLVNEDNHDRSLLVYKDGVMAYDIVNDKEGG